MAIQRNLTGFENGNLQGLSGNGTTPVDGTARTGCFYGQTTLRTTSGQLLGLTVTPIALAAGQTFVGVWRGYLRITTPPNVNGTCILLFGTPTTLWYTVRLNIDQTWALWTSGTGLTTGGAALPSATWVKFEATLTFIRNSGTLSGSVTINGVTLSTSLSAGGFIGAAGNFNRIEMGSNVSFNAAGGVTAGTIDWDDVVMILTSTPDTADAVLPSTDRIRAIPIIGQSSPADWTGAITLVQSIPPGAGGQTSAVAAQVTQFTHQTAVQIGATSIDAVKFYASCTQPAGSSTQNVRWNGVDYPVTVTTSVTGAPVVVVWGSMTVAAFNAAEVAMVNSTGASLTLHGLMGEALYTPNATACFSCQNLSPPFLDCPSPCEGIVGAPPTDGITYTPPSFLPCAGSGTLGPPPTGQ